MTCRLSLTNVTLHSQRPDEKWTPTRAEIADPIDDIEDLLEEALDPELSREELVSKVKEIQTVASGEAEEDETDLESDEGSDLDDDGCNDEDD
jgi:hypothetical protein